MRHATPRRQKGFTIVELLIATAVFSLVLVVITVGILSFSKAYYRGLTASSTQSAARTTLEDITQAIQFSGLDIKTTVAANNGSRGFCVGNDLYSYLPGWQLERSPNASLYQSNHVFVRSQPAGGCANNPSIQAQNLRGGSVTGKELVSPHMRVSIASISSAGGDPNLYKVQVRIVYGDADLLQSATAMGGNVAQNATAADATCRTGIAGNQFCAVSDLSTTVQKRVN